MLIKNKEKKSIRNKVSRLTIVTALVSLIVVGTLAVGGILLLRKNTASVYSELGLTVLYESLEAFLAMVEGEALRLTVKRAQLSDRGFLAWQGAAELLASGAEVMDEDDFLIFAQNVVRNNITAAYMGTEAGDFYITEGDNVTPADYDPRVRPWYIAAKEAGGTIWTEAYEDAFGMGMIITCATPIYDEDGHFVGAAGIDAVLTDLVFLVNEGASWQSETAFILDGNNETVVSGPLPEGAPWADWWQYLTENGDEETLEIASNISDGQTGAEFFFYIDTVTEAPTIYVIAYSSLEMLPWKFVTLIDTEDLYEPFEVMMDQIYAMETESLGSIDRIIFSLVGTFVLLLVAVALAVSLISRRFARSLTEPITTLQDSVADIAQGNLDREIDIRTGDELEELGQSVNKMARDLKEYIANLTTVTAEKERIGAELGIATQIQSDMLPSIFPAFPEREEFEIYASMQPAKEVGGDFYDFFLIDDDHLGVVMADVSGKSVPAALFMVIAKTLINNRARMCEEPQDVFFNVNNQLREGNETSMFVTAWFGVLQISTGKMTFVNAGHNPPLLKKEGGSFEYLKTKKGFLLAGMDDFKYQQLEMTLAKGDILYLYTDGVTEANNAADELYGEKRLQNTLNDLAGLSLTEMLPRLKADIDEFAGGVPQFDDITMLALKIRI